MSFIWQLDHARLIFSGPIDQTFEILLTEEQQKAVTTLNLRRATSISSLGVQQFMNFLHAFKGRRLIYEDCPADLLMNFSILPALLGLGEQPAFVQSFSLPYTCSRCLDQVSCNVEAHELQYAGKQIQVPERQCPRCKLTMTVDLNAVEFTGDLAALGAFKA